MIIWTCQPSLTPSLSSHKLHRGIQVRGMEQDLTWDHAAQKYEDVLLQAKYQW